MIKAIAAVSGLTSSAVGKATYTLLAVMPTFSLAGGIYSSVQLVTISDAIAVTSGWSNPRFPI